MTNEFLGAVRLRGVSNLFKVAHCRLNFTQAQASKCEMVLAITPYIALIFSCIFKYSRKEIYQLQSYTYTYKWFNIKPCSMYCGCKNNWAVPTNRHRYWFYYIIFSQIFFLIPWNTRIFCERLLKCILQVGRIVSSAAFACALTC